MLGKLLIPLSMVISLILPLTTGDRFTINSPRVTHWGEWGEWEYCPYGTYAMAALIQISPERENSDESGLNAIQLYCGDPNNPATVKITSTQGELGRWCPLTMVCSNPLVGFELLSERRKERNDETGASNIRFKCVERVSHDPFQMWVKTLQQAKLTWSWGFWTGVKDCGFGYAICGIRTQVQDSQGPDGDDTGLNNVDFACCDIDL